MNHTDELRAAIMLRKNQVCKMIGISTASLDRMRAKGQFPAPRQLGPRTVAWPRESVEAWLESRPVAAHFAMGAI